MAEDWKQLAAGEKDPEKVRLLIDKLIETLGQEQKRVREEIEKRLAHSAENKDPRISPFNRSDRCQKIYGLGGILSYIAC